ncbi:MAG: response regulator [Phenylobacterium sp.]|uniref:response regulator n=1 Tax=Phenylobacterium sp. TaxID=1871053 RepID=UPI00273332D2|nr:response regulator [Phenylobacterium sp.]MDP3173232.1 response regulator [Phenylobacterium sp.]
MSLSEFFIERVASEIRQQMDGILALANRASRQPLPADAQTSVAGLVEHAESVRRMLDDALDLRTIDSDGVTFDLQATRLRELMDEMSERWSRRAADLGVTLLVAYDGEPEACALIDSKRLIQVFDGFISQAAASGGRGAIEASLHAVRDGERLRLEGRIRGGGEAVVDTRSELIDIEARYGVEAALATALSWRIVEAANGAVRREANAGAGETMVFEFTAECATDEVEAQDNHASARAAHVLVVDDNATNRMVAQTLCEMFDCTSETAEDGVEAVEAAKTGRFDLILMDIKMPRMDGVAATRAIRALAGDPGRVPIIALTANADPDDAAGYIAAGMSSVVEKPMKPEYLLQALRQALADADSAAAA